MKKKRIIFFHPYSVFGGADLSISKLINSVPTDYDIEFITLSKKPKIRFYTKKKFKLFKLNYGRTIYSIFKIRKLIKKNLSSYEKNIIISNQNFANIVTLISSIFISHVKVVLFERNHISELDIKKNFGEAMKNNITKIFIKFFYKYADLIIGNSKELCLDLEMLCKTNVKLLYNFYNFKEMTKNSDKKIKYNLKFKNNIILNVGRLEEQKNQIFLLKVFKYLIKINKKYKLVIIGSGTKLKDINLYIKNNNLENHTQVIEGVKNALPYYKKCKLYISTSLYEGFPNVIIESIAMGIPVISTNYKSGIKELLLDGKGGTIFNNLNLKNFAKKISKVLDNKTEMKKKALLAKKNLTKFDYQSGKKIFCKLLGNL